jgi:hypothetical protein
MQRLSVPMRCFDLLQRCSNKRTERRGLPSRLHDVVMRRRHTNAPNAGILSQHSMYAAIADRPTHPKHKSRWTHDLVWPVRFEWGHFSLGRPAPCAWLPMPLIYIAGNNVAEQAPKKNQERLRSQGECGYMPESAFRRRRF